MNAKHSTPNRNAPSGNLGVKGSRKRIVSRGSSDTRTVNSKSSQNTANYSRQNQKRG